MIEHDTPEPDREHEALREAVDTLYERNDKEMIELLSDYLEWTKTHGKTE